MERKIKVLVIDDAPFILKVTETLLAADGFDVRTAPNGALGLKTWATWKPDLVLLDLMMPEKSGWDVLEEVKDSAAHADATVIIFSAKDDPEAREEARKRGAYAFILKPFNHVELGRIIRGAVLEPK